MIRTKRCLAAFAAVAILASSVVPVVHAQNAPDAKPAQKQKRKVDAQYRQLLSNAARQSSQGRHSHALSTYKRLLTLYPDDMTATRGYADALVALARHKEAEEFLEDFLERIGHNGSVRRSLAEIHASQGKFDDYLADVLLILSNVGDGQDVSLAWALRALDELASEEATAPKIEPAIRKLVQEKPGHPELRILLGDALLRNGDEEAALIEVAEADRMSESDGAILYLYADELYGSGRTGLSETAYRRAADGSTDASFQTRAWTRVAEITLEEDRVTATVEAYQAISDINDGTTISAQALLTMADLQSTRLRDYEGALRTYGLLESHPELGDNEGTLYLQMADCHLRMEQNDQAVFAIQKLKGTKADIETQAEGAFLSAEIKFFEGAFTEAQTEYQDLAMNFTRTRKTNDAVGRYLQIVRAMDQGETAALKAYAEMERFTRIGDSTSVIATAHSILETYGTTDWAAEALLREAELIRSERSDEAIALCERAVAEHPKARAAPYALGAIGDIYLVDLADKERALEAYERLLAEYPENLLSAEVRRTVDKLRRKSES